MFNVSEKSPVNFKGKDTYLDAEDLPASFVPLVCFVGDSDRVVRDFSRPH
jgi:hypothetical protein